MFVSPAQQALGVWPVRAEIMQGCAGLLLINNYFEVFITA
jgi:hypothetical protein